MIGEFEKHAGQVICRYPKYVTKQRSYVEAKIRKHEKKLILITILLAILLLITGIKFVRRLYGYFKQWRMRQGAI